jgi:acyl-CoA thioester hydrolase
MSDTQTPELEKTPVESDLSSPSWVLSEVRVRYAETDQMGVVYYSNYLIWFEVGRAEFCRQRGLPYREFEQATGLSLAVAETHCRYHAPAFYDELLIIRTRVQTLRKRMIVFEYEISKQGSEVLVVTGSTSHVVVDKNGRPRSFPREYMRYFE